MTPAGSTMLIRVDKQGRLILRVPLDVADKHESNTTHLDSWLDLPLVRTAPAQEETAT